MGLCHKPHLLFFFLKQKSKQKYLSRPSDTLSKRRGKKGKKCLTAPASLEKLTLNWKTSIPIAIVDRSCVAQTGRFFTPIHLFFGSPDEVDPST